MTFRALLGDSLTITQILLCSGRFYSEIRIPTPNYNPKLHSCPSLSAEHDNCLQWGECGGGQGVPPGSSAVATDCSGIRGLGERGRKERDQLFSPWIGTALRWHLLLGTWQMLNAACLSRGHFCGFISSIPAGPPGCNSCDSGRACVPSTAG